jgi:hypothetical protein
MLLAATAYALDGMPWQAFTAASGGWVLFGGLAWLMWSKIAKGDLLTRREADGKDAENLRLRESNDYLQEQLGVTLTGFKTMNETLTALRSAAEDRS